MRTAWQESQARNILYQGPDTAYSSGGHRWSTYPLGGDNVRTDHGWSHQQTEGARGGHYHCAGFGLETLGKTALAQGFARGDQDQADRTIRTRRMQLTTGQKTSSRLLPISSDITMIPVFLQGWFNHALRIVHGRVGRAMPANLGTSPAPAALAAANSGSVQSVKLLLGPNFT